MKTCICIKETKSTSGTFEVNCKYSFISRVEHSDYFTKSDAYDFLVFYPVRYVRFFLAVDFNEYFIDLQQHRQNLINQLLC